ncbi:sterol desaturase family protein [Halieaceae bacterium]|nr:sterol desaturase family protein [Halieaceae bacterium]
MDPLTLLGMVVFGVFSLAFAIELIDGRISKAPRPKRDIAFMFTGIASQSILSGAVVGTALGYLIAQLWPENAGKFGYISFAIAFPAIFIFQEFAHYWVHRYAHEWRWLWKLHRTHHSAQQLNMAVLYRYNIFWVILLPQGWFGAIAIYFGQVDAYVAAVMTTFLVNLATHSNYRWDLWLRNKMPWSEPIWKVLESVVTLPDTHHAHHAYGRNAHPNGNYAVTVFLFDVLFGTAKIPNKIQENYGLPISPRLHWAEELFWPVVRKPLLPKPETSKA